MSKLLTATEMAEFQRVVLGSNSKGLPINPGEFFKNGPPTRELVLNQVSTSRIISDPMDHGKASRLQLNSVIASVCESPSQQQILSPLMQSGH